MNQLRAFRFDVGDTITPIGWMLNTHKPTGEVLEQLRNDAGQRLLIVKWSDGRTARVAECVVEAA